MSFDRVIISANESWLYIDFWPLVSYAWRTVIPGARPVLAFVTERTHNDEFVRQLRRHGEVILVRPVTNITQAAQAKMARYYVAAMFPDEVCLIDDIDSIPIDRDWHLMRTDQREAGTMLLVGSECYTGDGGQVPVSMMTAEGRLFDQLFKIGELSFSDWLDTMKLGGVEHDNIESRAYNEELECSTSPRALGQAMFSDEGLIVQLRKKCDLPVTYARREYVVGRDTIDRSCLALFSTENLEKGQYLTAHTGRPYLEHRKLNDQIIDYIRRRYEGKVAQLSLVHSPKIDADMKFENDREKTIYQEICSKNKIGTVVVQHGSSHTLTNYLSRYYWVVVTENRLEMLNIYPAHYLFTNSDETVNFDHPRIVKRLVNGFAFVPTEKLPPSTSRPHVMKLVEPAKISPVQASATIAPTSPPAPPVLVSSSPKIAAKVDLVENKFDFLKDVGNASHRPLLLLALNTTRGDVAEYGMGEGSTPYLHSYCVSEKRKLFSFDDNIEWVSKLKKLEGAYHEIKHVDWSAGIGHNRQWDVVLIDHNPPERRQHDIAALKDKAKILIVHDTEDRSPGYMMHKVFPMFKYRCDIRMPHPYASAAALSNSVDVTKWRGTTFENFPYIVE